MFKILILQPLYNLSEDETEYPITKRPAEIELIRQTAFPSDFRDRLRTVQKQAGRPFSAGRRG